MRSAASPVKQRAQSGGLPVLQPATLKSDEVLARIREANADVLVVAAYGMILPQSLLDAAPHGALNIHASLLPRWRGAAPIQRALLAGDRETGISIMQMEAGLDTGPVLAHDKLPITEDDDAGTLHDKLAEMGAAMIVSTLEDLRTRGARPVPQSSDGVTYAHKIDKADSAIDWSRPAAEVARAVRAFRPAPGAQTLLEGAPLKVWRARVVPGSAEPGTLLETGQELVIACGRDCLAVSELQRPGGKRISASEFLRGHKVTPGTRFGAPGT
jgi:methionyl-tRNA formyltransferase